jgi:hypothetical protein
MINIMLILFQEILLASKGKERENFFKINVLVVDHIKNALVDMLIYYLYVCQTD